MDMTHILHDSGEHDANFVFGNVSWILVSQIPENYTDRWKKPCLSKLTLISVLSIKFPNASKIP